MVLVRKLNGKCRMCVDFIDLNKVCLKESFLLLRNDLIIDSTTRHKMFEFHGCLLWIQLDPNKLYKQRENNIHYGLVNLMFKKRIDCNVKV